MIAKVEMLTKECAVCPFWRDSETESGCAYPRPIDECEAFAKEWGHENEEAED